MGGVGWGSRVGLDEYEYESSRVGMIIVIIVIIILLGITVGTERVTSGRKSDAAKWLALALAVAVSDRTAARPVRRSGCFCDARNRRPATPCSRRPCGCRTDLRSRSCPPARPLRRCSAALRGTASADSTCVATKTKTQR